MFKCLPAHLKELRRVSLNGLLQFHGDSCHEVLDFAASLPGIKLVQGVKGAHSGNEDSA